eukprot:6481769-Amphidinium_carterae.2
MCLRYAFVTKSANVDSCVFAHESTDSALPRSSLSYGKVDLSFVSIDHQLQRRRYAWKSKQTVVTREAPVGALCQHTTELTLNT